MKYKLLVFVALAMAVAQPGMAQAFDISFDGSCDGLRLEIGPDLIVGGIHTGCVSGVVAGNVAGDFSAFPFDQQPGVGINIRPRRNPDIAPVAHTLLNFDTMQWGLYLTTTGEPPFLLSSGTFSFGPPAPANASSSAAMEFPEAAADAPRAVGPLDIAFQGFCDGLRLEIGIDNLVGGSHTGCEAGLVAGNVTFNFVSFPFDQQAGLGLTLGTFPNHTGGVLTLLNFATMQFAHYANEAGEVPVLVSVGTFGMGVPTSAQSSLPSTLPR